MSEFEVLESSMSSTYNDPVVSHTQQIQDSCFADTTTFYEESWKVEKIVAVIEKDEGRFYKVKWSRCIWQSEESLEPLQQMIQSYWQENNTSLSSQNNTSFVDHTVNCVNQNADDTIFNVNTQVDHLQNSIQNDEVSVGLEKYSVLDEHGSDVDNPQSIPLSIVEELDSQDHISNTDTKNNTALISNNAVTSVSITFDQPFSMSYCGEKKFKCETCGKLFNRKTSLQRHCLIHTGAKPWHCEFCDKSFNQNSILQRHLLIHSNKTFQCDMCLKTFTEKGALKRHCATHTSDKTWTCNICGKVFLLKEYLSKHMFLHTGTKPHQCTICARSFADSCALRRHKSIHESSTNHSCTTCHKQFKSTTSLKKHQQKNCVAFVCIVCHSEFREENCFSEHKQTHVFPFKCSQCHEEYNSYQDLSDHNEIHANHQSLCCTLCPGELFTSFKLLEEHVEKHRVDMSSDGRFDMFEVPVSVNDTLKEYNDAEEKKIEKIPKSFDELFKSALIP